ncbi:MAG: hypothetical protein ACI4PW_01340 [Alphaproteobacteria bacterium]
MRIKSAPTTGQNDIREAIKALTKRTYTVNGIKDDGNRGIRNMLNLHDVKTRDAVPPQCLKHGANRHFDSGIHF